VRAQRVRPAVPAVRVRPVRQAVRAPQVLPGRTWPVTAQQAAQRPAQPAVQAQP